MNTIATKRPKALLSLRNEAAARQLGWTAESRITWREFLEQYPYQAQEIREIARRQLSKVA